MAKSTRGRVNAPGDGTSGLGMVVRFTPKARSEGVQQLEKGGFRVASSKDFRSAVAVPNDFEGADVQYFERFGIAIVRRDGERLKPMLQNAMQRKVVSAARPERSYRALGGPLTKRLDLAQATAGGVAAPWTVITCSAIGTL